MMKCFHKKEMTALAGMVALCAACTLQGGTFTVKDGVRDWTLPASYEEGAVPSDADDVIQIPENTTVYLDLTTDAGRASLALVNTVQRIVPLSPTSVLDVTVGEDQDVQRLERPFTYAHINYDATHIKWGELIKRGGGELELANGNGTTTTRDFMTKITVKEGTLALPQQWPRICYVAALTVDAGATLVTAFNADSPGSSSNTWTVYYTLQGGGTITNRSPSSAYRLESFSGSTGDCGTFRGKITGNITLYNAGYVDFTGTASDTKWDFNLAGRRTRVASFGMRGQPSSIGAGSWVNVYPAGGTLGYVGSGDETTDRHFAIATTNASFTLDAGTTGGVTFTGAWKWWREANDKKAPWLRVVYLLGENADECVFGGTTTDFVSEDATATPVTGYFVKRGSGAWRFAEAAGRNHAGGYWVENGTLRYDSLEEAGRICSLGTSTNRTYASAQDLSKLTTHAPHAFVLGNANNATVGVFEYTGTNGYFCGTRPLVLNTNGVFRTNARKPIRFAGVSNFTPHPATLTLDGTSTCTNEMLDVSNGGSSRGPVSVVKDGTGTWKLGGNQTFSGSLTVKKGKLIVKQTEPGPYTWFRFTVRAPGALFRDERGRQGHGAGRLEVHGLRDELRGHPSWSGGHPGQHADGLHADFEQKWGHYGVQEQHAGKYVLSGQCWLRALSPLRLGRDAQGPEGGRRLARARHLARAGRFAGDPGVRLHQHVRRFKHVGHPRLPARGQRGRHALGDRGRVGRRAGQQRFVLLGLRAEQQSGQRIRGELSVYAYAL